MRPHFGSMPKSEYSCLSASRITAGLLLSFLAFNPVSGTANHRSHGITREELIIPPGPVLPHQSEIPRPSDHVFTLRHIFHHGTSRHPELHRKVDISHKEPRLYLAAEDGQPRQDIPRLSTKSHASPIERLSDRRPTVIDPLVSRAREMGSVIALDASAWTIDQVPTPDITDKATVLSLAYMAADAYVENEDLPDWDDVGKPFNKSADFGWESDGLRGHIFSDETNSVVVIGLKGTSLAVFDGEGTTTNDKVNDNLFASCCCGQQGQWTYLKVCDCATDTYSCNKTCVSQALRKENRYYAAARELYSNVTELYPDSTIWFSGHSLGGAISALLGLTYGLPVVTFEAVPDAMAASRLSLPAPPGSDAGRPQTRENTGAYHFGHTADPVFMGTCNGATASCTYAGYALESACHTGKECVYDVVADKGWRPGIGTHRIASVIRDVLLEYKNVPKCESTPECRDCAQWKMYESNGTETTTTSRSSTSTRTRTRTSTCKTPGWWGCLDSTATATGTTTTQTTFTTTSSTSTCKTPGWFGCKDKTTTTSVPSTTTITTTHEPTTTAITSSTSSTTCATPGHFWGCYDQTTTTTTNKPTAAPGTSAAISAPPMTYVPSASPTPTNTSPTGSGAKCLHRSWLGFCKQRQYEETNTFATDEM